jgi:zinc D-Ala-D-Ala dipeptidase
MIDVIKNRVDDLREKAIPQLANAKVELYYYGIEIDQASQENREKLVDLSAYGVANNSAYARVMAPYYRRMNSALSNVYLREGAARRLVEVNALLAPYKVEVMALDGYRPVAVQWELWNHFKERAQEALPNGSDEDHIQFMLHYVSDPRSFDPDDCHTWPTHNTGGAIDLTLRSLEDGQDLFMGGIFDDGDPVSFTRHYEDVSHTSQSAHEARRNRRLLYHAMSAVGFENYPYEWWHFDLGTQMWAMSRGPHCRAYYGRAELPI